MQHRVVWFAVIGILSLYIFPGYHQAIPLRALHLDFNGRATVCTIWNIVEMDSG
jgi:hypothetical protein